MSPSSNQQEQQPSKKFNLATCARPNILALQPYRCARDDYKDNGVNVLLDANENAYGPGLDLEDAERALGGDGDGAAGGAGGLDLGRLKLNRYPDP